MIIAKLIKMRIDVATLQFLDLASGVLVVVLREG